MDKSIPVLLALALVGSACSNDFDPYNEVIGLRVLAVNTEPPSLAAGENAQANALVVAPSGASVSYQWSWCPLPLGPTAGYGCAVTEEQVFAALAAAGAEDNLLPSFDLGSEETASFAFGDDRQALLGLCLALQAQPIPGFSELVTCDDTFEIEVRLDIESEGESIIAVKQMQLELVEIADENRNRNPVISELQILDSAGSVLSAPAERDVEYAATVAIDEESAQSFMAVQPDSGGELVAERETLAVTWFYQAGDFEDTRTSFVDGQVAIADTRQNEWTSPRLGDWAESSVRLFTVVRDNRGGLAWTETSVPVVTP